MAHRSGPTATPTPSAAPARTSPRAGAAERPAWGVRSRLVIDLFLLVSFVSLMSVPLTGLPLHEWWGIALIAVVLLHLLIQWDWTIASTRRLLAGLSGRVRLTYVLNWALFIATVLVMVSGILISEAALPALGLPTARSSGSSLFRFWRVSHTVSAYAVLVLSGVHLGLNWRWVVNAVRQLAHRVRSGAPRTATSGAIS